MRLVLDTNIVMDMLHFHNPLTDAIARGLANGQFQCFTDTDCLAELERVCTYPAFGMDADAKEALMTQYLEMATRCEAVGEEHYGLPRCRDADDQKFLILAARCQADLLITRDKLLLRLARHRHLPPPFGIVTAEAAASLLQLAPEHPAAIV